MGSSLGEGIAAGIGAWAGRIASEAARVVREGLNAARSEARAASPSKETTELGEDLGEGLIIGLGRKAGEILSSFQDLVPSATASSFGYAAPIGGGGMTVITNTVFIALSSSDLARVVERSEVGASFAEEYNTEVAFGGRR